VVVLAWQDKREKGMKKLHWLLLLILATILFQLFFRYKYYRVNLRTDRLTGKPQYYDSEYGKWKALK